MNELLQELEAFTVLEYRLALEEPKKKKFHFQNAYGAVAFAVWREDLASPLAENWWDRWYKEFNAI